MPRNQQNQAAKAISGAFSPEERELLIVKYAYLVKHYAGRMAMRLPSSVLFDELVSAGSVGLIDAIDKFDPSKDVDLKTYASYRIKGAILDELRSMDWYSRPMRKKMQDIEKAMTAVEAREGRPAKDWEIAEELGMELEAYFKILSNIHNIALFSFDEYIKDDANDILAKKSFQDKIMSDDDPDKHLAKEEMKQVVARAIRSLSQKEQTVISLYYYNELTLKEIGEVLSLTESRICQIHTMTLIKLRSRLRQYFRN